MFLLPSSDRPDVRRSSSFPFFQTKKLRKIDCGNRYCVWSIAHPQPASVCQPCYCDKVRTYSHPLRGPRTDIRSPFFLLFPHPRLQPHSSSAQTQKRPSPGLQRSTVQTAIIGTVEPASNSAGASTRVAHSLWLPSCYALVHIHQVDCHHRYDLYYSHASVRAPCGVSFIILVYLPTTSLKSVAQPTYLDPLS